MKKKRRKEKRLLTERTTLHKAACMVGLGPISNDTLKYFEDKGMNQEQARTSAVSEFLNYRLGFSEEDLKDAIKETKQAGTEDVIYMATEDEDLIKEIYFRKADSRNDKIIVRNYIPPQLHARFMSLNNICKDKRAKNVDLKTQIRFGKKDLEIFTKEKGKNEPFKKVSLAEFTEEEDLPLFDHAITWKRYKDRKTRRIDYSRMKDNQ